ncbi:MAG: hypothetical protein ABIF85_00055 [Nanoarchaeota archaeon]|nr:hypothetical protein [Nanoarchaeota archaeon]MBU4300039.1 hypothetical protein [Nanoarchaeota archaeon]MBU4451840.1 hypothetical protein [Nanoarchaeota archaeon]MCG2724424.1 hypothetical protein [archaeon]
MQTKIFEIGDLKKGDSVTWNYKFFQINITEENVSFFPPLKEEFKIRLKFPKGKATNVNGKEYVDGTFLTRVVNDQHNRFGKGTVNAICAIWADSRTKDGLLIAWLKEHGLKAGDKVKITILNNNLYLLETYLI